MVSAPSHGTNKARFPPVFTALQLRSNFGCLGWDESLTMSGPKGLFMLHVQMCTVSYRGGLELQTQSHRSW